MKKNGQSALVCVLYGRMEINGRTEKKKEKASEGSHLSR